MPKERIDKLVVAQNLTDSREKAKRLILAGQVYDENNQRYDKPGTMINSDTKLHIKGEQMPYVSRGGYKLEKALREFDLDINGETLLDIGSSTGGFTDCALQNGAKMSYAVDVGYNQLAYSLRQDERVVVMERTNFRHSKPEDFKLGQPTFASIDVSFISLSLILPALKDILKKGAPVVALIKPQFEAGPERVGDKGVVRDPDVHQAVLLEVLEMACNLGYAAKELTYSPITGGKEGNIEFLAHLTNDMDEGNQSYLNLDLRSVVDEAHNKLH